MTNESEVIMFPLKEEISGPITMDAEAFKANLAAAYSAGAMMMRERAAQVSETILKGEPYIIPEQEPTEDMPFGVAEQRGRRFKYNSTPDAIRALEIPC